MYIILRVRGILIFFMLSVVVSIRFHSASDLLSDEAMIVVIGASRKKADSSHAYGHGKIETFVAFLIALLLGLVGIGIMVDGMECIIAAPLPK